MYPFSSWSSSELFLSCFEQTLSEMIDLAPHRRVTEQEEELNRGHVRMKA